MHSATPPPGGTVILAANRQGEEAAISVIDDGDGMTPEQLEHAFERFYRGDAARTRDPQGNYLQARAEALPFADASFDLAVSYLTLIDIDDYAAAIAEMARVLRPGGSLLIANLNSFSTAGDWTAEGKAAGFLIDNYLDSRAEWESWNGILIRNWHRPFHLYMQALLSHGLRLAHFDEPAPTDGDAQTVARYRRAPWLHIMEWVRDERAP